jgi:hypothetical protein
MLVDAFPILRLKSEGRWFAPRAWRQCEWDHHSVPKQWVLQPTISSWKLTRDKLCEHHFIREGAPIDDSPVLLV